MQAPNTTSFLRGLRFFCPVLVSAFLSWNAAGQLAAPKAAAQNLIQNGDFHSSTPAPNLWYGVDPSGYLAGEIGTVPALSLTAASITETAMPVSVAVADLNGDGLPDIITMDVLGYLRIYFNTGTKQQPKFTTAELVPIFLTLPPLPPEIRTPREFSDAVGRLGLRTYMRLAPRIGMADMTKSGRQDIVIGDYAGEIFLLPNDGSRTRPHYSQPADVSRLLVPTTANAMHSWGNIFSPCIWDWNHDGRPDLLIGEGSYSANNIHLLINQGSGASPLFNEANHYILAYGDGKQDLSECVVDYAGDGDPSLLVSDRTGKISLFSNKGGGPWKPDTALAFDSYVGIEDNPGNPLSFDNICTVAAGDLHGTGLFDIVAGKTNGRISVAYNTGTRTHPKFAEPVELKSEAATPPPQVQLPAVWKSDWGLYRGNFYGYVSVVNATDDPTAGLTAGASCLKAGYLPSPNRIVPPPAPAQYYQGHPVFDPSDPPLSGRGDSDTIGWPAPANFFTVRQQGIGLVRGTSYSFSCQVRGSGVTNGMVQIGWYGSKAIGEAKITRGDRGSAQIQQNKAEEYGKEKVVFSPSARWEVVKSDFVVDFKNPALRDIKNIKGSLQFSFQLAPGSGSLYIRDVTLTPQQN